MAKQPRDLNTKVKIIEALVNTIFKYPEERIGQIITNCAGLYDQRFCKDVFYIEDKELLLAINNRIKPIE